MYIPKDQSKILKSIPDNDLKEFFADSLAKTYKNHLDQLYVLFNYQLKRNGIPNQSQLMLIISQYGPYSNRINKHMRQNKDLKDQNQRNLLGLCFVKIFLPNTSWKDEKGKSLLDLYQQFQKKKLQNSIPKSLQNQGDPEQQQSMLLQQFNSIDSIQKNDCGQQSIQQNISGDIFESMIQEDSDSDEEFVDIPLNVSRIKKGSSNSKPTQIQEINKEKFQKQLVSRKNKKIRKKNSQKMRRQVKLQVDVQKQQKKDEFKPHEGQKGQISKIKTPFQPDSKDYKPPNSQIRVSERQSDRISKISQPQRRDVSRVHGSSIFESIINYPSLPEENPAEVLDDSNLSLKEDKPKQQLPIFEKNNKNNQRQKKDDQNKPFKQKQKYENIYVQQITKLNQKLLKESTIQNQNEKIAKQIYQKYTSQLLNDCNSFEIPSLMDRWLDSLKPDQYLSFYYHQVKQRFFQIGPIQPRVPLLFPTLTSENLNQERSYLSIFQFYNIFEQSSELYLNFDSLNEFINAKEIIKRAKQDLKINDRLTQLVKSMVSDLNILGAQTTLSDIQTFTCEYFYRHYRPLNESLSLKDPVLPIKLKATQDGFNIFKFIEKDLEQKSNQLQVTCKDKLLGFYYQRQCNYNFLKKKLPSTIKQISKMGQQIISETIKGTIQQFWRDIEQMRVAVTRNLIKQWSQNLKKIGFNPKKFSFHPQSAPFVANIQYEVQPIQLIGNQVFQSLLEQVSSLVDKQKIIEKVLSKTSESKSQKIAFSHEYKMQVKKEYQNIQALHYYANKKSSKFQQELKSRDFLNFILKYIKFEKLLQKFASLVGNFSNRANHNQLLNYGYDTMVDQLNEIENQLNMFSLTLSLKSKVWFHSFAIGYLIKFILSINDLKNHIRKQTIEQVLSRQKIILDKLKMYTNLQKK